MKSDSTIKTIFTLNCEQASRLLSKNQDAELSRWDRVGLRLHLLYCRYCKRYQKQLGLMRRLFRAVFNNDETIPPELKLSDEKRTEIKKIIAEKKDFEK